MTLKVEASKAVILALPDVGITGLLRRRKVFLGKPLSPVPKVGVWAIRGVELGCSVGELGSSERPRLEPSVRPFSVAPFIWERRMDVLGPEVAGLRGDCELWRLRPTTTDPKPSSLLRRADACRHGCAR